MNKRERIMAIAAGACVGAILLFVLVRQWVVEPAARIDAECRKLNEDNARLSNDANNKVPERRLRDLGEHLLGDSESKVDQQVEKTLIHMVQRSGLDTLKLDVKRGNANRKREYTEINRTVIVQGRLDQLVSFLYLLKKDLHLHRISNVQIRPILGAGVVELSMRYATLVLDKLPAGTPVGAALVGAPPVDLAGPDRAKYNVIASRDLFRPYIQGTSVAARPPDPGPRPPDTNDRGSRDTRPGRDGKLRVVDLSSYQDGPDVCVQDVGTRQSRRYKIGEHLGGGTVVGIEYRPIPHPDNPEEVSPSRVILLYDREYWAVELGQNLDKRRPVKPEDLPPEIRLFQPTSAPAESITQIGHANG